MSDDLQQPLPMRVMWGSIGHDGRWWPNPHLSMSPEEQHRRNLEAGYMFAPAVPSSPVSAEQRARDMLDRMGVPNAQSYTAGDLVELANLIADSDARQSGAARHGRVVLGDKETGEDHEVNIRGNT